MLVFVSGCPFADPCNNNPCDDSDACTQNICTNVDGTAVCDNPAIECDAGLVCDAGTCVDPCEGNTCDDGDACNGVETCDAGACVAGTAMDCDDADACTTDTCEADACVNTSICAAGEVCANDVCVAACTADADCDDADACNGAETCVNGGCSAGTAMDCDDGLACTDDTCAADACVNTAVTCAVGETCREPGGCEPGIDCAVDADCDDTDMCTTDACGPDLICIFTAVVCDDSDACTTDVCDAADGTCGFTAMVCPAGETCVTGTCTPTGTFDFTLADDTLNGSGGDDVFSAGVGTLNPADIAVGGGGSDTVNASLVGASSSLATLLQMTTVNFTSLNDSTFDAANCAAIGTWGAAGASAGSLTLDNLENGVDFTMGSGFAHLLDAGLAGAGADFMVTLNGTASGCSFDNTAPGGLNMTLDVAADSTIDCAVPGTDCFGAAGSVTVTGTGNLTVADLRAGDLANDGGAWDVTGFSGNLTVSPTKDIATSLDFSSGGADELDGVDNVIIPDTLTFAHTLTFGTSDSSVSVDISAIDADDSAGALTLIQGANNDDACTLNLGGAGDGCGAFLATTTEFVNIVSGGTTANAIANVTSETGTAFVTESVTVTGTQDCTLGTVTSEIFDSTGLAIGAGVTLTCGASMQVDTGGGDDTITGSGAADLLDGGAGDDTILGGNGIDSVTGGAGVDTFGYNTIVLAANANNIVDFIGGASGDVLQFDATTFTDYTAAGTVTFDTAAGATAGANAAVDDVIMVDTAANILAYNSADASDAVIAIATDTGDIYYDADGNFTAGPIVIGNITTAEVANLVAANVVIVP